VLQVGVLPPPTFKRKEKIMAGTAIVERGKSSLEGLLKGDNIRKRFDEMLGKKSAGFVSSILSAVSSNKSLKDADPMSIISAAAIAATLDLPINPSLGFAHIVPYGKQAQFQMGWRGYVQLAQRTAQYATINCTKVYDGELVEHNHFTGDMKFDQSKKQSDKVIGYVAYFRLLNGFEKWFYMTMEEAQDHGKKYSKSYSHANGRWKNDFDSMALKTVIKLLLSKYGILSIGMETAIQADQAVISPEGEYKYVDNEDHSGAENLMAQFSNDKEPIDVKVEESPTPRDEEKPTRRSGRKASKPESAEPTVKEKLMIALNDYCNGDMIMLQDVLKEVSYFEEGGEPQFIDDIHEASDKHLKRAYDQLQNRIETEK
jgi:recombination protein RecT